MKKFLVLTLVFIFALTLCILGGDKKKEEAAQAQPQAQPAKSPEQIAAEQKQAQEIDLINKIQQAQTNPEEQAKLEEEYVLKFADSNNLAFVEYMATLTYQRLNNFDKIEQHGQAAMKLIPNNPVIPSILAYAYAENNKVDQAEELGTKALDMFNALQKPANASQEEWDSQINAIKSTIYSTLGYVHLQRASKLDKKDKAREDELAKTVDMFGKAIQLDKMDDISHYRLGIAYALQNNVDESIASYAKAVVINRGVADRAKSDLEKIMESLKASNKFGDRTLDGILDKAKKDLGLIQ